MKSFTEGTLVGVLALGWVGRYHGFEQKHTPLSLSLMRRAAASLVFWVGLEWTYKEGFIGPKGARARSCVYSRCPVLESRHGLAY